MSKTYSILLALFVGLLVGAPCAWSSSWQIEHEETQRLLNVRDESIPSVYEQYVLAIKAGKRALETSRAENGSDSPYTAISLCDVGAGYSILGAYKDALPYFEQGFETFRKLPKEKLSTLGSANLQILVTCMHGFGNACRRPSLSGRSIAKSVEMNK